VHALAPFPTASLLRDSTAYPCPPEVRHGARAPQADGTAWQEKKIKELENYLMMQTSLVVELRSTASLPAAKLVAANINGPTRTALRSDTPFATRRPLLGMIQEAHEAADETQMQGALKFAAAAAAALLVLVLLAFVSCQSGGVQGEWLRRWRSGDGRSGRRPVNEGNKGWWGWRQQIPVVIGQHVGVDTWL
jgi:hypothetical protein